MKIITFSLVIAFSLVLQTYSQTKHGTPSPGTLRLKLVKNKPSIYITFENYGVFTSDRTKQTYDIAWFRIHNNLRGDISFCSYDLSVTPTGKIGLHYDVEKDLDLTDLSTRNNESVPLGYPSDDICDPYNLRSGKSFVFGIPKSHLVTGTHFKVQISYPWEDPGEVRVGKEPLHFVYFRTINLPRN